MKNVIIKQETKHIFRFCCEKTVKYRDGNEWKARMETVTEPDDPRLDRESDKYWGGRCSYIERNEEGKLLACIQITPSIAKDYLRRAIETGTWRPKREQSDEEYVKGTMEQLTRRLAASNKDEKVSKAAAVLLAALSENE